MSRRELCEARALGLLPFAAAIIFEAASEGSVTGLSNDRVQIPVWQMAVVDRGVWTLDEALCEQFYDMI